MSSQNLKFVKTINLSEVPGAKKEKLYSFINENKIKFNRDESGEAFAIVKFENPETEQKIEKTQQDKPQIENPQKAKKEKKVAPNSIEAALTTYPTFFSLVRPLIGIRGKKITLYDLKYYIEEIYSIAFLKYSTLIKNKSENFPSFPAFTYEFISNKYAKKILVDQNSMNILLSVEHFKSENDEIRIFSLFLGEIYTIEDLLFFLFTRANIEKELRLSFIEKAKDETKIQHMEDKEEIFTEFYLTNKNIARIMATVYNSDDEIFYNHIMMKIDPYMEKNPNSNKFNCITSTNFLVTLVDDFHSSRNLYEETKNYSSIPFIENKQNEFYDLEGNHNERDMFENMLYYYNNQHGYFEDNIKNVLMTYIKEKQILGFFEKHFENDFNHNKDNLEVVYEIRDMVMRKIYALLNILFSEDYRGWNASFGMECSGEMNSNDLSEEYKELINLKNKILSVRNITDLTEKHVENFSNELLSVPALVEQIEKIVSAKKQM